MTNNLPGPPSHVDNRRLRQLYRSGGPPRTVLDYLANRERNPSEEFDVDGFALKVADDSDVIVSRADVVRALKALERAGCGKYIAGRRGRKSRFQRYVDMVAAGRVASGQAEEISRVASGEDQALDTGAGSNVSANGSGDLTHRFQLRRDFLVSLGLPADLTSSEAARLADFIRTLPFETPA